MSGDALDLVETELNEATERARRLVETTDPRRFTVRPTPSRWSVAECIAHLSISTEMFVPILKDAIEDARRKGVTAERTPSMDWRGRLMRWFLEPPVRSRMKTTAPFVPRSVRAKAESFAEFNSGQTRLLELLRAARGLDLRKLKIISPFNMRVRYNVYSAFRIVAAHERRHLWQAEQAAAALAQRKTA